MTRLYSVVGLVHRDGIVGEEDLVIDGGSGCPGRRSAEESATGRFFLGLKTETGGVLLRREGREGRRTPRAIRSTLIFRFSITYACRGNHSRN